MSHVCKTPKMAQQTSRPGLIITYDKPLIKNLCITRQPKPVEQWWHGKHLLKLHERLRRMLVNVELGLTLLYVTTSSASALDCGTVRDAMERHASASQSVLVLRWVKKCKIQTTVERKKCKTVIFSVVFNGIFFYLYNNKFSRKRSALWLMLMFKYSGLSGLSMMSTQQV